MTDIALKSLRFSIDYGFDFQVVKSWRKHKQFSSYEEAKVFFYSHENIIKAKPFVKWVGGKRQLISQFEKLYPIEFNNYFEPFLGGGAVFFNLQRKKSYLSDVNEELINVYQTIKNKPIQLIAFLETLEYSKDNFLKLRAWDREEGGLANYSDIERAGRFIFLNRTCFNGLYRVNSKGQFNVPFGKYKNPDFIQKDNILNASELLDKTQAEIKLQSFEKVVDKAKKGDFVYFDPPYDVLSTSANFTSYDSSGFGQDMQTKLADVFRLIISYLRYNTFILFY